MIQADSLSHKQRVRSPMEQERQSHKRHLLNNNTADYPHATKRRLIDRIADLKLSSGLVYKKNHKVNIFGSVEGNSTSISKYDSYNANTDRVVIRDIDQFLRDNSNGDRDLGNTEPMDHPITDVENVDLNKLVIPELTENPQIREYISKMLVISRDSANGTEIFRNEQEERLYYYRTYVEKYMTIIPYYNPQLMLWSEYLKWITEGKRIKSGRIVELDEDGDEEMSDDDENYVYPKETPDNNINSFDAVERNNRNTDNANHWMKYGKEQGKEFVETDDEMSID